MKPHTHTQKPYSTNQNNFYVPSILCLTSGIVVIILNFLFETLIDNRHFKGVLEKYVSVKWWFTCKLFCGLLILNLNLIIPHQMSVLKVNFGTTKYINYLSSVYLFALLLALSICFY